MGVCKVGTSFFCVAFGILHVYHPEIRNTLTVRQKIRRRKKQMRERDENAYIRFFALWFAAGMTLGVLLLLAASHTGMKEGNSVRLFQAEAFFWKKNFRKGLLFLSSKGTVSTGICGTSLWIDGNRCVFCHCCRLGIWFSVWRLSLGCLSAERNGRSFILFFWLFFRRFSSTLPRYF